MPPKPKKTRAATANVAFINKQDSKAVREDCRTLLKLMHALTGEEPTCMGRRSSATAATTTSTPAVMRAVRRLQPSAHANRT